MATTIKIHVADGRDCDSHVDLTPDQAKAVLQFLCRVTYGDIYRHVDNWGDGNKLDSPSDREVRMTKSGLDEMRRVFERGLC